jgi:hypothetical protein
MASYLFRHFFLVVSTLVATCFACIQATAQEATPPGSLPSSGQASGIHMTHTPRADALVNMHGMHTMPATVTHVDPKTGIVDVTTEGMVLRVHFPPASMMNLKIGDKIGLYMAYSMATIVK